MELKDTPIKPKSSSPARSTTRRSSLKQQAGVIRPKDNRACDFCRRRKIKCHTEPGTKRCSLCTRLNHSCTYDDPILKRGPKKMADAEAARPPPIKPTVENTPPVDTSRDDPEAILAYHLNKARSLLNYRSEAWNLDRETVELVMGFFELFGPCHELVPLEMFIYLLKRPAPPPSFKMLLSTICCVYLKHTNYPSPQFDHFYASAKAQLPMHNDLGMRLLSSSLLMIGHLKGQREVEAQLPYQQRCHLPPPCPPSYLHGSDSSPENFSFSFPRQVSVPTPPHSECVPCLPPIWSNDGEADTSMIDNEHPLPSIHQICSSSLLS
ncbi:hypothetical protein DSO57_1038055 [Entomophthora muscae]|uniref:Uncharacterized protein n=1 Tax=Entomophthora muscae TaxID=34485 RepID=A0ACC2TL60_9FUNG|nr:hypothetical protein DSO57_1038055 [Entomophthora muscae]